MGGILLATLLHVSVPMAEGCPNTIVYYPPSVTIARAIKVAEGANRYCNRPRQTQKGKMFSLPYCATKVTVTEFKEKENHMNVMVRCHPKPGPGGTSADNISFDLEVNNG